MKARFEKKEFEKLEDDNFKIGAVISDGMWLNQPKWRKMAKVSEQALESWISENLPFGVIEQSATGAKSYRMPYDQIMNWYHDNGYVPGEQLLEHVFPARIWDGMTEVEGFLSAPLREIGMVTFHADRRDVVDEIKEALVGIGRIRESETGVFRIYSLSAQTARKKVEPILREAYGSEARLYSRNSSYRRELKDFSEVFGYELVSFYQKFARSLVKGAQETISIFVEEREDQESQITLWVIAAIEKFDESASVPFSGYLNNVINKWVYDLPDEVLGKDLSSFQRDKAKAKKLLRSKSGGLHNKDFSNAEIAEIMGIDKKKFFEMESKNKFWTRMRASSSLTWEETSEEKRSTSVIDAIAPRREDTDIRLANQMSSALIESALSTGDYESAFSLITQIGIDDTDSARLDNLSIEFVKEFGTNMGLR